MINQKTALNMVIGNPIDHSRSPELHGLLYQILHCNAVMMAHASTDLESTMQALMTLSVRLIAVTMPYKKKIMAYLDEMSDDVKALQSANTVIVRDQKRVGYNTNVDGIAYALRDVSLENKNALILGAGGAASAAAYYCQKQNATLFYRLESHAGKNPR